MTEGETAILAKLEEIRCLLERNGRQQLSRPDQKRLAALLPVIGAVFGSEMFLSRELAEHQSPGLQLVLAGMSTKSIGKLLSRAEGQPIAGYLVEQVGEEINACIWRVVQVADFD